jgi:nitroreductase
MALGLNGCSSDQPRRSVVRKNTIPAPHVTDQAHHQSESLEGDKIMRSRRSCSSFKAEPPPREVLEDLVAFALAAPSGSNNQLWTFHILPDRNAVVSCGELIMDYYSRLIDKLSHPLLRLIMPFIRGSGLHTFHTRYAPRLRENIELWRHKKVDKLFHGAPAVILIGSKPNPSCPAEDALLAAQNLMLGAHALGLGTCFIGFAVRAMSRHRDIQKKLHIPDDEKIYAALAVGYPKVSFKRLTRRQTARPHFFN